MVTFKIKYLFLLILIPLVFAQLNLIEITPQRTELSPGEVYQTEIVLNNPITELKNINIKLYSLDEIPIPVSPFLSQLDTNYYFLYFEIPFSTEEGIYQLKIEDQSFLVNGALEEFEGIENITITKSQPPVSITPGHFLLPLNDAGQISITTESKDISTNIFFLTPEYMTHPYITEQSINPHVPRTFTFDYNTSNATKSELIINTGSKQFKIPIFIEGQTEQNDTQEPPQSPQGEAITFFVDNFHLSKTISFDQSIEGNLYMSNNLNISLEGLNSEFTGNLIDIISISPSTFEVSQNSNFSSFMSINPSKNAEAGTYSGELIISNNQYSSSLKITIVVEEELTTEPSTEIEVIESPVEETIEESNEPAELFVPWNLSEGYEEEAKVAASPFMYLIVIFLAISIIIFLLSGKKTTKKKSFSQLVSESQKK